MNKYNILIVGVGGQGSLLASKLLGRLFLSRGLAVKVNEVHGMSQRGGSVVTSVKAGERVDSPLVAMGECDLLIALEELEALRWIAYLAPEGRLAASTQRIAPMPVITGQVAYPDARAALAYLGERALWTDAAGIAERAGNSRSANVALLGAASRFLPFSPKEWERAVSDSVPERALAVNLQAFQMGVGSP